MKKTALLLSFTLIASGTLLQAAANSTPGRNSTSRRNGFIQIGGTFEESPILIPRVSYNRYDYYSNDQLNQIEQRILAKQKELENDYLNSLNGCCTACPCPMYIPTKHLPFGIGMIASTPTLLASLVAPTAWKPLACAAAICIAPYIIQRCCCMPEWRDINERLELIVMARRNKMINEFLGKSTI